MANAESIQRRKYREGKTYDDLVNVILKATKFGQDLVFSKTSNGDLIIGIADTEKDIGVRITIKENEIQKSNIKLLVENLSNIQIQSK